MRSNSKNHRYGVQITTRLQDEAREETGSLIWRGRLTPLITDIAGAGNAHNMKRRLCEYGVIRPTSDEHEWEVTTGPASMWDNDRNRVAPELRRLTRTELGNYMINRQTDMISDLRESVEQLVTFASEAINELRAAINELRQQAPQVHQLTLEEYMSSEGYPQEID
jgi:hypothetical protein